MAVRQSYFLSYSTRTATALRSLLYITKVRVNVVRTASASFCHILQPSLDFIHSYLLNYRL
jgi:hypothetical protein